MPDIFTPRGTEVSRTENGTVENGNGTAGNGAKTRTVSAVSEPPISGREEQEEEEGASKQRRLTAFERISHDMMSDARCMKEVTLGKRIAFYRIRGELGSGNFSQVKMGVHGLTKEKVAIKILDKTRLDSKTQRLLSREISSMERLHHPNIIRLYEVIETLAKLHIVMEFAGGGELFTKISSEGKIPEAEAKPLFAQIVSAVQHMHSHKIIHRDIKAENVFFAGSRCVKVGDFGFSTQAQPDQTLNTFCGSPPYAAPELFKDESYYGTYVDVWALGILLYFMVTGIMPYRAETVAKLKKVILEGNFTVPSYLSDSCSLLVRSVLKPVPQDRLSLKQVCNSEWLTGETFPSALEPYRLLPSDRDGTLSADERDARLELEKLGITEEHLMAARERDSRSSVTGTYRVVLHRIHKKALGQVSSAMDEDVTESNGYRQQSYAARTRQQSAAARARTSRAKRSSGAQQTNKDSKQSKTCAIL